jgi:RES domain
MSVDAGTANLPGALDRDRIDWAKEVELKWWRNAHEKAPDPLEFSNGAGRFSHPTMPFKALYLGTDSITCFWESGVGRNLALRFPSDRTITEEDLCLRIEYTTLLEPTGLRLFDATDAAARRSVGAHSSACFQADHATSRQWAIALYRAYANGILYASTRSNGTCLALFESKATKEAVTALKRVRRSYDDAPLLASLFRERVRLL